MTSTTPNYNLVIYNKTGDKLRTLEQWQADVDGISASNMIKIDTQIKVTADDVLDRFITAGDTLGGSLKFTPDNTLTIGNISTNRPNNVYVKDLIKTGAVTGDFLNGLTITPPATSATLTIAEGKSLVLPVDGTSSASFVANSGTGITDASTFNGYTLHQIVQSLINLGFLKNLWLLKDEYTDTVSAGSVNGTSAVPTGGIRTVTDTNSKISVGSGVLDFAVGSAVSDGVWYPIITRQAGITLFAKLAIANTAGVEVVGWDSNTASNPNDAFYFSTTTGIRVLPNAGAQITVGSYTATSYTVALVMRTTGTLFFVKGGIYTNWTLLYNTTVYNANAYPVIQSRNASGVFTNDFTRVPTTPISITPIASDSFNRADGSLGVTDGNGTQETGGSGITWVDSVGTWGISTNKAMSSALSGGIAIASLSVPSINLIMECAVTRNGGLGGIVLRYVDSSNYIYAVHTGTNARLVKVVAGTPTTLIDAAVTYSAGARLIVTADSTKFRLYYNETLVGTEQTISDAVLQAGGVGLYTNDITNSFDSFAVWYRGTDGEYNTLLNTYGS